jgi:hypothetical protein
MGLGQCLGLLLSRIIAYYKNKNKSDEKRCANALSMNKTFIEHEMLHKFKNHLLHSYGKPQTAINTGLKSGYQRTILGFL